MDDAEGESGSEGEWVQDDYRLALCAEQAAAATNDLIFGCLGAAALESPCHEGTPAECLVMRILVAFLIVLTSTSFAVAADGPVDADLLLAGGTIHDGSGADGAWGMGHGLGGNIQHEEAAQQDRTHWKVLA